MVSASATPTRVMVFVDGSNLYYNMRKAFGRADLDLGLLVTKLAGSRTLIRTYYYNAPADPTSGPSTVKAQQRFYGALGWIPRLEVRFGKLLRRESEYSCPDCGHTHRVLTYVQKGVDTRFAIDLVTLAIADAYDVGLVVSGDSDLVEAVKYVKGRPGKEIENAFTREGWSPELRAIADTKTLLDADFLKDCWIERPTRKN